jgi:hypothetical protein
VITRSGASSSISSASTVYREWLFAADSLTSLSISALDIDAASIVVHATSGFDLASGGQLQSSEMPTSASSRPSS